MMIDGNSVNYLLMGRWGSVQMSYTLNGHINLYTVLPRSIKRITFQAYKQGILTSVFIIYFM
jgi:hypothetical protein